MEKMNKKITCLEKNNAVVVSILHLQCNCVNRHYIKIYSHTHIYTACRFYEYVSTEIYVSKNYCRIHIHNNHITWNITISIYLHYFYIYKSIHRIKTNNIGYVFKFLTVLLFTVNENYFWGLFNSNLCPTRKHTIYIHT